MSSLSGPSSSPQNTLSQGKKDRKNKKGKKDDRIQSTLENAREILFLARDISPVIPVPFLGAIFSSAGIIVDAACHVRRNKHEWADLAQRVASIARIIRRATADREELVDNIMMDALNQLYADYREICKTIEAETDRKLLSLIFQRDDISTKLVELSARLSDSMQTFRSISSIRLEFKVDEVKNMVLKIDETVARLDERTRQRRRDTDSTVSTDSSHDDTPFIADVPNSPVQFPWDDRTITQILDGPPAAPRDEEIAVTLR